MCFVHDIMYFVGCILSFVYGLMHFMGCSLVFIDLIQKTAVVGTTTAESLFLLLFWSYEIEL